MQGSATLSFPSDHRWSSRCVSTPNPEFYRAHFRLCLENLTSLYNTNRHCFDYEIRNNRPIALNTLQSCQQTAFCLLGLNRANIPCEKFNIVPHYCWETITRKIGTSQLSGLAGLYIWANAVWEFDDFTMLASQFGITDAGFNELVTRLTTRELSYLTSGLLHEYQRSGSDISERFARKASGHLLGRYFATTGLMNHTEEIPSSNLRTKRWTPYFTDQVYAIQAFSFASHMLGDHLALDVAEHLASKLVSLQGDKGQWWWQYDSRNSQTIREYPVYTVHQHSLAPLAMVALEQAGGTDYSAHVEKGRAWLNHNELNARLVDLVEQRIWSGVNYCNPLWSQALSLLRIKQAKPVLEVMRSVQPGDLGWFLYAAALETETQNNGRHIL